MLSRNLYFGQGMLAMNWISDSLQLTQQLSHHSVFVIRSCRCGFIFWSKKKLHHVVCSLCGVRY